MQKIIVLSDSHGDDLALCRCIQAEPEADTIIFLGDGERDLELVRFAFPKKKVYAASGNCDFMCMDPDAGLVAVEGVLFFYTHGQIHKVKNGLENLGTVAVRRGAQVALFGHTHQPCLVERPRLTFFNPGSVGRPLRGNGSYGVVTVEHGKAEFEHKEVPPQ